MDPAQFLIKVVRSWPWLIIVASILAAAFAPLPVKAAPSAARTVRIEARSFEFSPPVIHVQQGERVNIELVAADVVHGLYIDGYGYEIVADPGQTATLTFIADKAGSFRLRCSVTCGALHPFMIGKLNVGVNTLFYRAVVLSVLVGLAGFLLFRPLNRHSEDKEG
jgi:heme/copper-type cytochrome/quinol oxidase subunit 2